MNRSEQGRRIIRQVKLLAAVGLGLIIATTCLISWRLAVVRALRRDATVEQQALERLSKQLLRHSQESQTFLLTILEAATALPGGPDPIDRLSETLAEESRDRTGSIMGPSSEKLGLLVTRLATVKERTMAWRTRYDRAWQDVVQQRTLGRVRAIIAQMHRTMESREGERRLDAALRYRRWRAATGAEATRLSQAILTGYARQQSREAGVFSNELAECAQLIEELNGEEQLDVLADLKDNRLNLVLERLERLGSAIGWDTTGRVPLPARPIAALTVALFGRGAAAPASEKLWPSGLFGLRHDLLRLRQERGLLRDDLNSLFHDIEANNTQAARAAQARAQVLTQQVEDGAASATRSLLVLNGGCAVLFLWLAWGIMRGIRGQIHAMEGVHRKLLLTSRLAGMAEVATGVLHNVGNVLNSVNVSATVISDGVRNSKAASVGKVAALLREHEADLGAFLTTDPRGKQVAPFLCRLSEHLSAENAGLLKELGLLHQHIDHIKEVVASHERYGKVSGVAETVDAAVLIEDALCLGSDSMAQSGVQIVRDVARVPAISVDRHKVLQVLVHLVRNAEQACVESGRTDRRLHLGVTTGIECIRIAVTDNGVGIPPENLSRIFNHGFTTKQEGHGFSLHASVLAVKEMGGRLYAQSEGAGCGATFTVELPLRSV